MKALIDLEFQTRKNLLVLFTTGLSFWISITFLLPVLPAYIEDLGAKTQQVGLVMGCFAIGLLLSRTWLGRLADQRGRKIVVLIGTLVGGIAPLGYILVQSISGLMAVRAFHGISIAAFTTGYSALVVDLSPPKQRGEIIGYMSLVVPIGMAIGPALGGLMQDSVGYQITFFLSAFSGLLALIGANQVKENQDKEIILEPIENVANKSNRTFLQLLSSHSLFIPALVLVLIGLVFGSLVSFLPLFIRQTQINFNAGLFYAAAAIASFTVRIFAGQASDRYGRGLFITISLVCYFISMILLIIVENSRVFLLSAIFEGIGAGLIIPMIIALISDRSSENERGQVFALCIGGFDLGIALGGPILGSLAAIFSYREMFALSASLAIVALLIFMTQSSKNIVHSFRFAIGQGKDGYALIPK
ncbi:MAG: MFS transporter [Moorea sp. SIO2B7]|nr:MFS transporter [Moorena sp. SIO2B7]